VTAALLIAAFIVLLGLVLAYELGPSGAWARAQAASDRLRETERDAERRLYPDAGPYRQDAA
jgi:hypothetical protein